MNNQQWLDSLSEMDVLLYLAGFLYHYDSGLSHEDDEGFTQGDWIRAFSPMIEYVESRIGAMKCTEILGDWYKKRRPTMINLDEVRARAEKAMSNLEDGHSACAECPDYREPRGCNREDGSCDAYDVCQDAAELISNLLGEVDRLTDENVTLKAEHDALAERCGGTIPVHCSDCELWGSNGWSQHGIGYCEGDDKPHSGTDFCSYGKKKEAHHAE